MAAGNRPLSRDANIEGFWRDPKIGSADFRAIRCGRESLDGAAAAASVEEVGDLAKTDNFDQYTRSRYKILPTTK
ncbi:hypothetical protein Z949_152 [Sulfitobacter guttiformis KCTC 32187]|nr:hypothetical protein Z949_152 [Sulfitobacter guttiformis KCTC 32187]